jgi:hypothetical protein
MAFENQTLCFWMYYPRALKRKVEDPSTILCCLHKPPKFEVDW